MTGVVFSQLAKEAHSVILTSGTLSPINSFECELGAKFPLTLEAPHVIKKEQIWIGSISNGPSNYLLNGVYKQLQTFQYHDEIGNSILRIIQHVPKGVLVFLPSYGLMEKLMSRWEQTGTLQKVRSYDLFHSSHVSCCVLYGRCQESKTFLKVAFHFESSVSPLNSNKITFKRTKKHYKLGSRDGTL